jgi:DNA-binding IclR family transcriptional regulator
VLQKLTEATVTEVGPLRERLEEVRRLGFAMSLGERDAWAAAVAAPLRVGGGAVIGSLSICGPLARFAEGAITEHGKLVRAAAERISARLG